MRRIKGFLGLSGFIFEAATFRADLYGIDSVGPHGRASDSSLVAVTVWGEIASGLEGGNRSVANENVDPKHRVRAV